MDLIKIFDGHEDVCRAALKDLKAGVSAREVASTHIEPNLKALQRNAGQKLDPLHMAYMLEFVVLRSHP